MNKPELVFIEADKILEQERTADVKLALDTLSTMRKQPGENREQFRKRLKQLRRQAGKVKVHGHR